MALFIPFSGHALTSQTTRNAIQGSAPYLTFDGGRTRIVNTNDLLGITLSDGKHYTPSTNSSSITPIVLPVAGQSFADIRMLVPTNTNSVALSSLIGPPYNYWGDEDGDSGITATGSLSLSIVDKYGQYVSRSTVPTICKAPYKFTLSSTNGTLSTRYGVPNRSDFSASSVTYYINPNVTPMVCFARPNSGGYAGPALIWDPTKGFLTQSNEPSSYGQNFPTTGANGLYFDLLISGSSQALSWPPISQGGITVKMTNSTATSVRVTLTGPSATRFQINSDNPSRISKPSLPQTFELVGRDGQGNPVVKYGFTLKQWFVHRVSWNGNYSPALSWCNGIGYRMPRVKDLTNAVRKDLVVPSATPSSFGNSFMRHIGSGFFTEWGYNTVGTAFELFFWTSDSIGRDQVIVGTHNGNVMRQNLLGSDGLCAYP